MLKIWILVAIAVVATSTSPEDKNDDFRLYGGQSQFAISMMNSLSRSYQKQSIFFAPHGIYRTLLRAYVGSGGAIKQSLKEVLFLDWAKDENDIADAYKTEKSARDARSYGDKIHFSSADKFYIPKDVMIPRNIADVFSFEEVKRMDFSDPEVRRSDINAFVDGNTEGNISGILPAGSVENRQNVFLVNAAIFKGFLINQFDPKITQMQNFYGDSEQMVETMSAVHTLKHGVLPKENCHYVELPYESDEESISMLIFLPLSKKPNAVDIFLSKFSHSSMRQALLNQNRKLVDISLPRIQLKSEYFLKDVLEDMGLKEFFSSNFFGNIIHKTFAEIFEKSTSTGAGTSNVDIPTRGQSTAPMPLMPKVTKFHCNNPFAFSINDRISNEVLFFGVYRGPTE